MKPVEWAVLTANDYGIRFERHEAHINFRVFNVCQGENQTYELLDCMETAPLADWETFDWELNGSIKWDGCINWETNPQCMMHGCSPRHAVDLTAIFETVYAYAKLHHDLLGDETAPMPEGVIFQ